MKPGDESGGKISKELPKDDPEEKGPPRHPAEHGDHRPQYRGGEGEPKVDPRDRRPPGAAGERLRPQPERDPQQEQPVADIPDDETDPQRHPDGEEDSGVERPVLRRIKD